MKLFQINDTEWYAAESAEQAIALYRDETNDDKAVDIHELSDAELDRQLPAFDEDERPIPDTYTSGREMLAEMTEPGLVASSEW